MKALAHRMTLAKALGVFFALLGGEPLHAARTAAAREENRLYEAWRRERRRG